MLASVVYSDDEADGIEYRIFLLPKSDYKVLDTWNVAGLRGTGSSDVEVRDTFVPDYMSVGVGDHCHGDTVQVGSVVSAMDVVAHQWRHDVPEQNRLE